jgi:type VI secretion system secreted protein VgrG
MIIASAEGTGDIYRLSVGPYRNGELWVQSFHGREAMSKLYEFDIVVTSKLGLDGTLERAALGHRALLTIQLGRVQRDFHGIICGIEAQGRRGAGDEIVAQHRLRLVPRAWITRKRKNTRIFQDQRVDQVMATVLREALVPSRFRLEHTYPVRKYITQYDETDYAFVTRLAAENGMYFYFAQPAAMPDETGEKMFGVAAGFVDMGAQQLGAAAGSLGAAAGSLGSAAAGALGSNIAGAFGVTVQGEMLVFCDNPRAYAALDDERYDPKDLEAALVDQLTQAAGAAIGAATEQAAGAADGLVPGAGGVVTAAADMGTAALQGLLPQPPAPELHLRDDHQALLDTAHDTITTFVPRRTLRASNAVYTEFDPDRPKAPYVGKARADGLEVVNDMLELGLGAAANAALGSAGGGIAGQVAEVATNAMAMAGIGPTGDPTDAAIFMEVYDHHGPHLFPDHKEVSEEARRVLRHARRTGRVARGSSFCLRPCAGRRFRLEEHPLDHLNGEYVFTAIEHHGVRAASAPEKLYRNSFSAVPKDVVFVPQRPKRRVVQNCLTAIVVGPGGEEIHTNEKGEIKVRFHWDRTSAGENASCWIRTMQSWGGAGWGTQFIPRVGMEVIVTFDAGDPDRPIVIGCVYNGVHPTAFPLPAQKNRSGIRTASTPGEGGHNEISFDDTARTEQIFVHAQHDLDVVVQHVRHATVKVDDELDVTQDRREKIGRNRSLVVEGDSSTRVTGNRMVAVTGETSERLEGDAHVRVSGRSSHELVGDARVAAESDVLVQVRGSATTVVGRHDAKRSYVVRVEGVAQISSSEVTEISSDKALVFRCGNSSIRLGPDKIELCAPSLSASGDGARMALGGDKAKFKVGGALQVVGDQVLLKSSGASIGLSSEAKIDGGKVLLNSPEKATDEVHDDPKEPTRIELADQNGDAIPRQPFRIVLDDGTEITGTTDEDGKAEVEIEGSGKIFFPDLGNAQQA